MPRPEPEPRIVITQRAVDRRQWRFPRSKRRRIRNRWEARDDNCHFLPRAYHANGVIYMHPVLYEQMNRDLVIEGEAKIRLKT